MTNGVVLVTGATGGIGTSICEAVARKGFDLVLQYRSHPEKAQELQDKLRTGGQRVMTVQADLTNQAEVDDLFTLIKAEFGGLWGLVNNAGVTRDKLLLTMSEADWDFVLDNSLKSAYLCTRGAAKFMLSARQGRVVNISSVVGVTGNPGQANYAAAKAGMIGFTKALAREFSTRGITVNAIAPGYIDAGMARALPEKAVEALLEQVPLKRPGSPEDVAAAVTFLLSQEAGYITGQVLAVDGGMSM
jgi:3-oxoacyl-[acyl-carrier protein] reductase